MLTFNVYHSQGILSTFGSHEVKVETTFSSHSIPIQLLHSII